MTGLTGPTGAQGATGLTGATGPTPSSLDGFSISSNQDQLLFLGDTVLFQSGNIVSNSSNITYGVDGTFTINKSGYYLINFVGLFTLGGSSPLTFNLNGANLVMPTGNNPLSTNCVINAIIHVPTIPSPSTFQVIPIDSDLTTLDAVSIQFLFISE